MADTARLTDEEIARGIALCEAVRTDLRGGHWDRACEASSDWLNDHGATALRDLARLRRLERAVLHEAEALASVRAETWRAWLGREGWQLRHLGGGVGVPIWMHGNSAVLDGASDDEVLEVVACAHDRPRAAVLAELLGMQEGVGR